jgi:hypothetical protein
MWSVLLQVAKLFFRMPTEGADDADVGRWVSILPAEHFVQPAGQ